MRLDVFLAGAEPALSRTAAAKLIKSGAVRLNSTPGRPSELVEAGDVVEYELGSAEPAVVAPESIPLRVVHQDADLLVVDKPPGMVVHPAAGHPSGTLVNALLGLAGTWSGVGGSARPGIVHRLDKGTSGLLVIARNDVAHRALARQLAERTLSRTYLAIVRGLPQHQAGVLEGDIARDPRHRQRMAVVAHGRHARTRYEVMHDLQGHSLLKVDLDTGRTHQIRVHMAALGHPIAGDDQYGTRRPGDPARPMLHAWRLRLEHPRTSELLEFQAPPPGDFVGYLESLGGRLG